MSTVIATVVVDRTQVYVIQGTYEWQRDPVLAQGVLVPPHGNAFPAATVADEFFWRDDQSILYKRNSANTAWEAVVAAPAAHASTHSPGGTDPLATGVPVDITDNTNAEGVGTSFARNDHQHAHGNRGGGLLHDVATGALNGFMSAADKTKLDGIEAGAEVNDVDSVFGRTGAVVAVAGDYDAVQVDYDNTTSELAATDVQAAIDELAFPRLIASAFDNAISTQTTETFQVKVTLNAGVLPAGDYKIKATYGWNLDGTGDDFEGRIMLNGVQQGELHKQEPKDAAGGDPTGTTQRMYNHRERFLTLAAGAQTFTLEWRTDDAGVEASIWEASLELWRYA